MHKLGNRCTAVLMWAGLRRPWALALSKSRLGPAQEVEKGMVIVLLIMILPPFALLAYG